MHATAVAKNVSLESTDAFPPRHIGPNPDEVREMLAAVGFESLDAMIDATIPADIRLKKPLDLGFEPKGEFETLGSLKAIAAKNKVFKSFIGQGYYGTITPGVIQRNILENPGWYTQYTPYQAEIAQGRLEALLNFQTMVSDLTALPLANASLLDEATAAAEAMAMCVAISDHTKMKFIVADDCHPQTIAVVKTRAESMGIEIRVAKVDSPIADWNGVAGVLVQYPTTDGRIVDYTNLASAAHAAGALVVYATDLLALTLIKPPGEFGADIAIGSAQRFGVPLGFGGPHAAFMSTKNEYARKMPGRLVGVSKDAQGKPALRLALQTREQHIRREKATSNICTAQVLLAVMASMYAVYHGPEGLKRIAQRVLDLAFTFRFRIRDLQILEVDHGPLFDTVKLRTNATTCDEILAAGSASGFNLRSLPDGIVVSFDERTVESDIRALIEILERIDRRLPKTSDVTSFSEDVRPNLESFARQSDFLAHPVFNTHHSETEMLRYIKQLESRDLSLTHSMIPLGSCTMKLNATSEMYPVSWPEIGGLHPFAPADQTKGYAKIFKDLEKWLAKITGFAATSLQPNAGSQGEYAGLLAIRGYHASRGEKHRDICLIPTSAHGTNPASAVIAGLKVVAVACDERGNVRVDDLKAKAAEHAANLACLMITYPSTHGVFEESVREICKIVHKAGGQVYMDGANMNAQVGLTSPGAIGADVCHLNLHKTFCIPHGGGGPGMGPICVAKHLAPFLPADPTKVNGHAVGAVSAAPYSSASILVIPWMYIAMMGGEGLKRATEIAILNANYMAKKLESHYPILFRGEKGLCAHEFILDCRDFEKSAGVKVEDIAKRLIDYGFHAPTMSFPVPGTLMIEPTESESKAELDRFVSAMIAIREEIRAIENGQADRTDNVLKGSPHTIAAISSDDWNHKYSRQQAAYPAAWLKDHKFWPSVGRIDNPFGDRNLVCTCPPMSEHAH